VADCIANQEISVEYCPTGKMVADYFNKPLQGTPFRKFRDIIMNCQSDPHLHEHEDHRSVLGNEYGVESTNPEEQTDYWIKASNAT
jgi:hypothetical protein